MKSELFSQMKSKSFIGGFIVGVFTATIAAILLFSFYAAPPDTKNLKGAMIGSDIPIGTPGVILAVMTSVSCPPYYGPEYIVQFTGYEDAVICTGYQGLTENQNIFISQYIPDCVLDIYVSAASQ
jgi:hypothetical protein